MATQSPPQSIAARIAERTAYYEPPLQRRIRALAAALPEPQARELLDLVAAIADASGNSMHESCWQQWEAVLAHVPGLAVALEMVKVHTGDMSPGKPCEHGVRITC